MQHQLIYITGVSGSGKTSVGSAVAAKLGIPFYDGDDFHSSENKAKMGAGTPLTDEDRMPWLRSINRFAKDHLQKGSLVIACSALKEKYRALLGEGLQPNVRWFHLQGSFELIHERMAARQGHYMKADMLRSQFEAYETPTKGAIVNINQTLDHITEQIIRMNALSSVGLIGMGVMGTSLARNIASKGFSLSVYNRFVKGKEEGIAAMMVTRFPELKDAQPFEDLAAFVASLQTPRRIILMVNAGQAVDAVLQELMPLLSEGDTVMDGGNSNYIDTVKRQQALAEKGLHFVGAGISGGEEGALQGPSIMPGGSMQGCDHLKDVLDSIAAKNEQDEVCCDYIGDGGAGHFVKMVHNGIEYAEMALIAELYTHLRYDQGLPAESIAELFSAWSGTEVGNYLMEISVDILRYKDGDGSLLLDKILDRAGAKGTGGWTSIAAAELGVPIPSIAAALYARFTSALKEKRQQYHSIYPSAGEKDVIDLDDVKHLYHFCRLMNHHQGFSLIAVASDTFQWNIDSGSLLRIWSGGCIIRSRLLHILREGWAQADADVLLHPYAKAYIMQHYTAITDAAAAMMDSAQSYPVTLASVQYFKGMTEARSNAYMIQAQRDHFGAHTYKRIDDPSGAAHHTDWKN